MSENYHHLTNEERCQIEALGSVLVKLKPEPHTR